MITINLLPVELRPIKRTPVPYILCAVLLVLSLLMCFQVYMSDTLELNGIMKDLAQNEDELKSLQPSVDKYNELFEEKQLLATQLKTINEIVSDRIIWSQQLHNLARLSEGKNMWFDGISIKTRTTTVMVEQYNPETDKTTKRRTRVSTSVLVVSGYVGSGVDGSFAISNFMEAAESDPEFSSRFALDLPSVEDTDWQGMKVRKFELEYKFAPAGGSE